MHVATLPAGGLSPDCGPLNALARRGPGVSVGAVVRCGDSTLREARRAGVLGVGRSNRGLREGESDDDGRSSAGGFTGVLAPSPAVSVGVCCHAPGVMSGLIGEAVADNVLSRWFGGGCRGIQCVNVTLDAAAATLGRALTDMGLACPYCWFRVTERVS